MRRSAARPGSPVSLKAASNSFSAAPVTLMIIFFMSSDAMPRFSCPEGNTWPKESSTMLYNSFFRPEIEFVQYVALLQFLGRGLKFFVAVCKLRIIHAKIRQQGLKSFSPAEY